MVYTENGGSGWSGGLARGGFCAYQRKRRQVRDLHRGLNLLGTGGKEHNKKHDYLICSGERERREEAPKQHLAKTTTYKLLCTEERS